MDGKQHAHHDHGGPAWSMWTRPRGLQDSDFLALSDWLAALDRPS
ncbi:hypothetical protein ACF05X_08790 [Streptomyces werraensis]